MINLKKILGEAGAGVDLSHGSETLRDVLVALVGMGPPFMTVRQDPTVGIPVAAVVPEGGRYDIELAVNVVDSGSAGSTTVRATLNAAAITGSSVTIGNADPNNTTVTSTVEDVLLEAGDVLAIEVTAADASSTLGTYSLYLRPVRAE